MSTIVMNIDGCDIAHEALMLEEYSEEKKRVEWKPQNLSASEEEMETFALIPSTAFPQCP